MPDKKHYHLIGIGGAGMSAIAGILHDRGDIVTGSDRQENDAVRRLRNDGVKIAIGHSADNVDGADIVVYSAAIPRDNPEMVRASERGIKLMERPEMLGKLMEPYKHRIAISGTHGKTTTTSMVDAILDRAGHDATVLIGGDLKTLGGNARLGNGSTIVTEACEAFASFLHLYPSIAVITNIDADHLDYYGNVGRIEDAFRQFVSQVDEDGCVIACGDDPRVRKVLEGCGRRVVTYGMTGAPNLFADKVDISTSEPEYTLVKDGQALGRIRSGVPGEHNLMDSLAAAGVALELGAGFDAIRSALADFRGAGRRFEVLYNDGKIMVVDDYAHHPTEVAALLKSSRSFGKKIIAVFQPHLYSRTKAFCKEFAEALSMADEVIITPIYAAREQPMDGVSAENIVECLRGNGFCDVRYEPDKDGLASMLAGKAADGDMVLVIGAGDIRAVGIRLAMILAGGKPCDE